MQLLDKRLTELEAIAERENKDYETGAWIIFEEEDGTYKLSSSRLGKHDFESKEKLDAFIEEHHKGTPPSWGGFAFIRVSYPDIQGEPPKEL